LGRAALKHHERVIACPAANTLLWDGDDLVDVTTGVRVLKDGSVSPATVFAAYPFDRAIGLRHQGILWSIAYANRQTKALLLKDGQIHRELNRSFYFAHAYDYPVALAVDSAGSVVLIHCPCSFDVLVVEDAETALTLATRKTAEMEFHSRLAVSQDGRHLIDAGWFWHPLGGAWLCDLSALLSQEQTSRSETSFSLGAEIDSAVFLDNANVVVSSTDEVIVQTPPT